MLKSVSGTCEWSYERCTFCEPKLRIVGFLLENETNFNLIAYLI